MMASAAQGRDLFASAVRRRLQTLDTAVNGGAGAGAGEIEGEGESCRVCLCLSLYCAALPGCDSPRATKGTRAGVVDSTAAGWLGPQQRIYGSRPPGAYIAIKGGKTGLSAGGSYQRKSARANKRTRQVGEAGGMKKRAMKEWAAR